MERWDRKFFFPMTEKKKGLKNAGNLKQGINWQTYADKKHLPGIKKQNGTNRARPPDYRKYRLSSKEWLRFTIFGVIADVLCAYTFYRSMAAFFLFLPAAFYYPFYKKKDLQKEQIRQLTLQFKEGILVLSSFLSAGYSLENSFFMSVNELEVLYGPKGMITEEFADIAAGIRMNRPVEFLLADMGRRSGIQDIDQFAQVFAAAKRSGGELTDIIGQTAGIIRDKIQVQEEIHTMTAARVFEQKIMNGIPFGIILYIDLTSPGFFQAMYHTWLGRICMTVCLGVYVGAVYLAKKILDIPI